MHKKVSILILLVLIVGCKKKSQTLTKTQQKKSVIKVEKDVTGNTLKECNLSQIQGLWKSFSYYLEHEEDDKDEHVNGYYKVVSKDKSLDIILKHHDKDSIIYKTYKVGFIDNKNEYEKGLEKPFLKDEGRFLVKDLKEVYDKGNFSIQKFSDEFRISQNFRIEYDTYELLEEGIDYESFGITEKVQFKKILTLPVEIYRELKEASQKSSINYIRDFNVNELSSKVQVTVSRCYFYEDRDLKIRKKAFLVKNDKAYLEEDNDKSVKVYFDGKIITSGYLDKSEVKIVVSNKVLL